MTFHQPGVVGGAHAAQQAKADPMSGQAQQHPHSALELGAVSSAATSPSAATEATNAPGGEAWVMIPKAYPVWRRRFFPVMSLPPDTLNEILEYCTCTDLTRLACTSKAMRTVASSPNHWRRLYLKDFHSTHRLARGIVDLFAIRQHPQQAYKHRFQERVRKVELAKNDAKTRALLRQLDAKKRRVEYGLDLLHIRLLMPSTGAGLLATVVMIALRLDGIITWPAYVVLLPLWLIVGLVLLALASACFMYAHRNRPSSVYHGMFWGGMSGPIWFTLLHLANKNSAKVALATGGVLVALGLAFLTGLTVKLSLPEAAAASYHWYQVMIPAWAMLGICYLGPLLHLYDDMMVYVLSVIFVWTPIVAVSLLLCLRLDFNASGLPLYKIFTPLWAVDLVALLFPAFLFLVVIIRSRYRPEHLSQSSLAWLASWIILGPFVVFEVLLCLYESQRSRHSIDPSIPPISALRVFTPLILWFGILTIVLSVVSMVLKTGFERRRRTVPPIHLHHVQAVGPAAGPMAINHVL